jgi:hypothetical protein
VLDEPELGKGPRAEPLSMGPRQGHAPAAQLLPSVASFYYYNYLVLLLYSYDKNVIPLWMYEGVPKSFRTESITKCTLTTTNTR